MARRPLPALASDFSNVWTYLQSRGICPKSHSAEIIQNARKIHECTFSLILWRFRLQRLPVHGKVFIEEIASDALQILPQVMMGYGKTAKLLTRGIIENTLRHLYFSDHRIEFEIMNREPKWYLGADKLLDYMKTHPLFLDVERKFDALARVSSLYSDLSAGIHGRRVSDLEMRVALQRIVYDQKRAEREMELVRRCAESVNFLMAVFHREQVRTFQTDDRRIILRTMPKRAREVWLNCNG